MNKTPYDTVLEPIEKWCEENYYTDFIVTILIDDAEITQLLEWDAEDGFIWNSDWWEGQEDVKLEGFIPVSHIRIRGIHGFPPIKVQAVNWIPVTERLPDSDTEYVLCCGSKGGMFVGWAAIKTYDGSGKCTGFQNSGKGRSFTHWMPLPKPPKDGES